ncbi:LamG-like jellyroll fold domain-containing protein [Micromonospora krabiensis]|uniref:Intein C-terminal splicing region/RHS repeat-associated core domain-containing protein n=1 Tax=Micromonospora krabiensis TaxID=307121 RepID=A0A1C3N137_9ACTN|nr:LamG-like jellyroll fold domain-containing protein [Micromonospora krabiensis]SBV26274.1 intein C-terminal splicing region/RHS repeat-associated core domain-containing protein [Micromonospora krabiensis]
MPIRPPHLSDLRARLSRLRSSARGRRAARHSATVRSAVAVALVGVLVMNVAGSGVTALPSGAARDAEAGAGRAAGAKPAQSWGSASDRSHVKPGRVNRELPKSERSRFPLHKLDQKAEPGRNRASVAAAPAVGKRGYDKSNSRERTGDRTANQRVYDNADGTQTTEFSSAPINYRKPDGSWAPIELDLVPAGDGSGWRTGADSVGLRLADRGAAGELARLTFDGGAELAFGLAEAADSAGRVEGRTVTYPGVRPEMDLRLEPRAGGVKETLVLHSAKAPTTYLFPLRLRDLTAKLVDGQVVLTAQDGRQLGVIPPGYMMDSGSGDTGPATSTGVTYEIVTTGGQPALKMTLDRAWLADPARTYPVEVDPTVGPAVDPVRSDSSMYVHGSNSTSGGNELLVGRSGGQNAAAYLKFGDLVSRLQYHTIYGAALSVVNFDAASCKARAVTVHPVTASWSAGTDYSYPGPAVGGSLASRSFAHGYIGLGQSQSACPAAGEMFDLGVAGRNLVQRWVNGTQANYGLSLRASTTDSTAWKKFAGTGTANPPSLYITHTPYNAGYAIPKPTPEPPVLRNQNGKVKVTVTNLGAEAWSPSNYYLAYRAYNATTGAAVTQQRAANLPATLARGAKVTLDATIKALPPGSYFLDFTMVRSGGIVFTDQQVPPGRIVLQVFDVPPVVQELYPENGYQAPTLTPLLWARAVDTDAPPGSTLSFKFEICDRTDTGAATNCTNSGYQAKQSWSVPSGRLAWSKTYLWRSYVKDTANEVTSPYSVLTAAVPQPDLLSRVGAAPGAEQGREFDAQTGNFSTAAVDATVATVGPELNLGRTYNSLDPRTTSAFGAGWSSRYDMVLTPDNDGSGNVVIRYPDGQEVRFGRNADGTYAAPAGRVAKLTVDSTSWKLVDRSGSTYQFALASGKLQKITDVASRSVVLSYDVMTGKPVRVYVANSLTNTAGRALRLTWTGNHITSVATDPVNGEALTWNYTYNGDLLTKVCGPDGGCTGYDYAAGSHYRTAVLDAKPDSYYHLGESEGTSAASDVAINLGKDVGTYRNVTLGQPGVLEGTSGTAAAFNGTSAYLELPKGLVKKSRDASVELWFKIGLTQTGGPLLGYQDKAVGTAPTSAVPVLYTGTDGKLRGQFATGSITPITSSTLVNDNKWHHVVLSAMANTQTMYLDGVKVGELTGQTIDASLLTFNQVGLASTTAPASWPAWGSAAQRYFAGTIDEVAVYSRPLGPTTVAAHFRYAKPAAQQLIRVSLPSGRVATEVEYDTATDRVKEYTDQDGGTWKLGQPTIYGGDSDLRRGVQVLDPANRPYLYEYDALNGQLLRTGTPLGIETRQEDRPPQPTPSPSPTPTPVCSQPDPNDPAFCTVIPGDSGGPVFVLHPLDGMAIRTFSYNDQGMQSKVTNENGDSVEMTYDGEGRLATRKSCRTATQCYTNYYTYSTTITNPLDPRKDLAVETRDGRSESATDLKYRTTMSYAFNGQLAIQTNPDGSSVSHTYTNGGEAAVGGGNPPSGLLATSTDSRGKVTRNAYYSNGDLARVTEPSGLTTEYTYDTLGRRITEKVISDSYPAGVTTTITYDKHSRVATVTGPVTTDAVNGTRHQSRTTTEYDADGNPTTVTVSDLLGGDPDRVSSTEYDDYGRPAKVVDAEGNETTYGYDRFGNKTTSTDANGNRYDWAYTAQNKVAEVRLRDWRSDPPGSPGTGTGDYLVLHSYSYDFAGRLASDTDAMGRRLEYQYYRDDLLEKITLKNFHNPDGTTRDYVVEENTYDGAGNVTRKVAGNGTQVTEYTPDRAGKVTSTVVDPGGLHRATTVTYDLNGNVTRSVRTGNPSNVPWSTAVTSETVEYTYDDAGNVLTESVVAGTASRTTSYTYDQRGLRLTMTDPRGNEAGANKAAYTTTYEYDERGQQVRATGPTVDAESDGGTATPTSPISVVGYNTFGEQVAIKDPRGLINRSEYDKLGRPVRTVAPTYQAPGVTQPVTPEVRTSYDPLGNVLEEIDPDGTTRYTYDQLNRLVTRDEPAKTNDDRAVTSFTYTRTGEVLSVTDPNGVRTESTYDDLDRQVSQTLVERHPTTRNLVTRMTYDDAGNATSIISPTGATTVNTFDATGAVTRTTRPTGEATLFGYDHVGRQIRISDGLGRTSRIGYDLFGNQVSDSDLKPDGTVLRTQTYGYDIAGHLTSATDPYETVTRYQYDAAGRLVKQVEPVNATESITTSFGYDAAGNRTRYTDGRSNSTIYTYNSLGLPESAIEPATVSHPAAADRTWTIGYDAAGNATRLSAPGGVSRTRTFDASGRMTQETGSGGETATATRTLDYDRTGRLVSVNAPGGTNSYRYNDRGALVSAAGPSGTASFDYDDDGLMTSRTDMSGTAAFGYVKGRLDTVTDGITGQREKFGYNAAGQVTTIDYGAGRVRAFGYDDYGRVDSDVLRNSANQVVASVGYEFDLNGHVTRKKTTGTAGAGDNSYTYDKAGRLLSWTSAAGTVDYVWDASGNRVKAGAKTATFDERNRLISDGDYTYSYSARGTLRGRTSSGLTEQFAFDAFDRLTAAKDETYQYDGLDRVVSRTGTAFVYAGLTDDVVHDGAEYYARGPSNELLATGIGSTQRLSLTDAHGDVVAAIDPADTQLPALNDSTAYDPFGKKLTSVGDTGNLGYQGDWTDPTTGQVDMGARWYEPGTGTFTSRDSATYSSGDSILANRYTYGAGAPLDFDDPDGHWPKWLKKAAGAVRNTVSNVVSNVSSGISTVWNYTKSYASMAWSGLKAVGRAISDGAKWLANKAVTAVKYVGNAIRNSSVGRAVENWARQQAQIVQQRIHQAKVAVTNAAKAAVKQAVKFTKLPVVAALTKPLMAGIKIVSTGLKMLPAIVATTTMAIQDPKKFQQKLWLEAAKAVGSITEGVTTMWDKATQFVEDHAAEIAGFAAGAVVGLGCGAAIGWTGVGAVACGALAGAVGSAVTGAMEGKRGWDLVGATAFGAVTGALGGAVASIGGAAIGAGIRGLSGGLRAAGSKALSAGIGEARAIVSETRAVAGSARSLANKVLGKCNSFTAETRVLMADGSRKAISAVRVGDRVLATDPTTGRTEARLVTALIVGTGMKKLVDITVDVDGAKGDRTGQLTATDGHPFWLDYQGRWSEAKDLQPGYVFETADHRPASVAEVRKRSEWQTAYNLTVDGLHTYYVVAGDRPVLSHNCEVVDAVEAEAARVAGLTNAERPGVIEGLQIPGQRPIVAYSDGGAGNRVVHPIVRDILDSIPTTARGNNHGGCGLVQCLTEALGAGLDPTGATATAVLGRAPTNSNFLKHIGPCDSCKALVQHFDIDFKMG